MRSFVSFLSLAVVLLAGCDSMSDRVRDRFSPVPPKVRQFDGDLPTVFAAAQIAFKRLDFVLTDSSGAPVALEASSRIMRSESPGDSRQLVVNLHLHQMEGKQTEVAMRLSLQMKDASLGGPSAQDQREHGFYETYFSTLQQVLQERANDH